MPLKEAVAEAESAIDLAKGQNVIDIHLEAALFNDEALAIFHDLGLDTEDAAMMTTFVLFDFYEFETQVSPLGIGSKPHYGHTSRFQLYADDFFLHYLQTNAMTFHICRSNGLEFVEIGTCSASFQGILKNDKSDKLQYYADIVSTKDQKKIIGKLDYSILVQVPMAQAIRTFKERTVALNLLTVSEKDESGKRFQPRADINHLTIEIGKCTDIKVSNPIYAAFSLLESDIFLTNSTKGTVLDFAYLKMVPLAMGTDLDRYLRSSPLSIYFMDETKDIVYGIAQISLLDLALNDRIDGGFEVKSVNGNKLGFVNVSLYWGKPYKADIVPVVSLLDQTREAIEFHPEKKNQVPPKEEQAQKKAVDSIV